MVEAEVERIEKMVKELEELEYVKKELTKLLNEYRDTLDSSKLLENIDADEKLLNAIKQYITKIIRHDVNNLRDYVNLFDNFVISFHIEQLIEETLNSVSARKEMLEKELEEYGNSILNGVIADIIYWAWHVSPSTPCETYNAYNSITLYEAAEDFATDCTYSSYSTRREDVKILKLMPEEIYNKLEMKYHDWLEKTIDTLCKEE